MQQQKSLAGKIFWYYDIAMSKAKRGRPPIDPALKASEMVPVRMTTAERQAYQAAADAAEVSLSEWIRGCCARAAKRQPKDR